MAAVISILALAPAPAGAELFSYLAFGDSITEAIPLFDNSNPYLGGYPGRLEIMFGCTPTTCEVVNAGKGGERTAAGVTRLDGVLNQQRYEVLLLMHGTNDVFKLNPISNPSIEANLQIMADKGANRDLDTVLASIIWFHKDGTRGTSRDNQVQDLRNRLLNRAASRNYNFSDPWSILCPAGPDQHGHTHNQCYNQHYFGGVPDPDPVGHPNASGFDMMADEFFDAITLLPVPGAATPISPAGTITDFTPAFTWDFEVPAHATWYQLSVDGNAGNVLDVWLAETAVCGGSNCVYSPFGALAGGDYTWRIRTRNPAGFGPWSAALAFTIDSDYIFGDGFETGDTSAWTRDD